MSDIPIYPGNDFASLVGFKGVNTTTGRPEMLETGTATAFLATSGSPTATAADPTLSISLTHISHGRWLVLFDAALLTAALMASLFGLTQPWLIAIHSSGVRTAVPLTYTATRLAEVL